MAAKKEETKATAPVAWEDRKVRVTLFMDNEKYKEDVTVVVNGKAFRVKRGVEVEIPMYVWKVLESSMAQDIQTAKMVNELSNEYKAKEKEFNF